MVWITVIRLITVSRVSHVDRRKESAMSVTSSLGNNRLPPVTIEKQSLQVNADATAVCPACGRPGESNSTKLRVHTARGELLWAKCNNCRSYHMVGEYDMASEGSDWAVSTTGITQCEPADCVFAADDAPCKVGDRVSTYRMTVTPSKDGASITGVGNDPENVCSRFNLPTTIVWTRSTR